MTENCPPGVDDVEAALAVLPRAQAAAGAAHLLTPAGVVVGMQIRAAGSRWSYRGFESGPGVRDLRGLVLAGQREGDTWAGVPRELDVAGLAGLIKVTRSGAGHVLTGARELLGLANAYVDGSVPEAVLLALPAMVARGDLAGAARGVDIDGIEVEVVASAGFVTIRMPAAAHANRISRRDAALRAAVHASRLRHVWAAGATDLVQVPERCGDVFEFDLTSVDSPDLRARVIVGAGVVQEVPVS